MTAAEDTTVLRGGTVVGTRDGSLVPDRDVVVRGGRIVSIVPTSGEMSASVVDVTGRFIVPGFVDAHAHPLGPQDPSGTLRLMMAQGITGFRQMSGSTALLAQRRDGRLDLPDDGPALLAMPGAILSPTNAGTPKAAIATVREQAAAGADFIKIAFIAADVLPAVQDEARRLGVPVAGHLPEGVDVRAAARRGLQAIEHLGPGSTLLAACSTEEEDILAVLRSQKRPPALPFRMSFLDRVMLPVLRKKIANPVVGTPPAVVEALRRAVASFSEAKARSLAEVFATAGTWQCPTLIRLRTSQRSDDPTYRHDDHHHFVDPQTLDRWHDSGRRFDAMPAGDRSVFRDAYDRLLELTGVLEDAGAPMLAGSDSTGAAWEVPGFALHREFDELARAGLTPLRVLQTTTLDAARFLGTAATMGVVEEGKDADLVVLDDNPVERVAALHAVFGVVRGGIWYSRAALDDIQRGVAAARSAS